MRNQRALFATWVLMCVLARPVLAHHSQAGYETDDKIKTLKGTVVEYSWRNPHVFVVWEVKDDTGKSVKWIGEMPSVTSVIAEGLSKNSLKVGDEIVVTAVPARSGSPESLIRRIAKADGTNVYPRQASGATPNTTTQEAK